MKITAGYEVMSTDCDIALCITKHVLRFGKKTCSKTKKKRKKKKKSNKRRIQCFVLGVGIYFTRTTLKKSIPYPTTIKALNILYIIYNDWYSINPNVTTLCIL